MPNRLAESTSPYLLQHADNPVDWWPWGDDAFAEARRRDVPVLLSIGYAACHWCHVMAHESFEDEDVAKVINEGFVAVKVDREERPDVDAVYMSATQALTGHGGWPMTCFLTADGEPFHCGTYYPPTPRHGLPGFTQLLDAVRTAWVGRGDEVRASATRIAAELAEQSGPLPVAAVDADVLAGAVTALGERFDAERGGFGGAPKFPPSATVEFLLRHHERTGSELALTMVDRTCEAMARGGMYDQLGGGFARYSVDADWVVPHFEKMLYDNALLLTAYTHLHRVTGSPTARRVAVETAEFLLRELRTAEGGFAASLDADTDGVEGATYAWTSAQLVEVLGPDDGAWVAELCTVTDGGTFEHGTSVLQMRRDLDALFPDDARRWARVRPVLLAARDRRPQPPRDDKVVTEWNGMAIAALCAAGTVLQRPEWVDAAAQAADLVLRVHRSDGRLLRGSRDGVAGTAGAVLADHAWLVTGLLALYQAGGDEARLVDALAVLDDAIARFADAEHDGAWFDTPSDGEALYQRPADVTDGATPSGASSLADALLTASALTGSGHYRELAERAVARAGMVVARAPQAAGHWAAVAEALTSGPLQVAVVGPDDEARATLLDRARELAPGGTVVLAGHPGSTAALLADRGLVDGVPAAYVCRGFVCDRPVTGPSELGALLRPVR